MIEYYQRTKLSELYFKKSCDR